MNEGKIKTLSWIVFVGMILLATAQERDSYPVDPQTGRAVGAKQISPEDLNKYIDKKTKSLIIDVRDPAAFARQTIKGAINIPLDQLSAYLKNVPKGIALFFT